MNEIIIKRKIISILVAEHMSLMCGKDIKPSDVMFVSEPYGGSGLDHAFAHIKGEPFIHTPNCKYYMVKQGKGYCNPGDNREGDCVLLTGSKECDYRKI